MDNTIILGGDDMKDGIYKVIGFLMLIGMLAGIIFSIGQVEGLKIALFIFSCVFGTAFWLVSAICLITGLRIKDIW